MKEYFKSVFEIIKENWKSLVLFEIAYRVFTSLLLLKGGGWLVNRLLEYQGYSYMTLDNYSNFISVSYTHLDVYKRQGEPSGIRREHLCDERFPWLY